MAEPPAAIALEEHHPVDPAQPLDPLLPARRSVRGERTGMAFHQVLPGDERLAVERHLREFDRLGDDLKVIERDLARSALGDEGVKRLMTIPGVDMVVALAIVAAIGDVGRFEQSQKLVSYLGLNPSVRQSGPGPAYHGRITKQGHARWVQAAGIQRVAAHDRRSDPTPSDTRGQHAHYRSLLAAPFLLRFGWLFHCPASLAPCRPRIGGCARRRMLRDRNRLDPTRFPVLRAQ